MKTVSTGDRRTITRVSAVFLILAYAAPCGLLLGGCQESNREESAAPGREVAHSKTAVFAPDDWKQEVGNLILAYGNIDGAIARLDGVLKAEPENARALAMRGGILVQYTSDRVDEGEENIDLALSIAPTDAAALAAQALVFEFHGHHDRAMQTLERAVTINPVDPLAFVNRGLFTSRRGDLKRALVDLSKAVEIAPKDYRAYVARGATLQSFGEYEKAILDFNTALTLQPNSATGLLGRYSAWHSLGNYHLALHDLDEIDRRFPRSPYSHVARVAVLISSGDLECARSTLLTSILQNPDDAGADYKATTGKQLSAEALEHGKSQVTAMLRDRPEMAQHIVQGDALWNWAARKFAGEDVGKFVHWDPTPPAAALSFCGVDNARGGFLIRVHPRADDIERSSKLAGFEDLWARAVFELQNVTLLDEVRRVESVLRSIGVTKTEYVETFIEIEQATAQRTRAFYAHVFLPWAIDSGYRETDPSYWQPYAGSPYYVNLWRPGDTYWDLYGVDYDIMLAEQVCQAGNYEDGRARLQQLQSQNLSLEDHVLCRLHYWLAMCELELGETAKARESIDKAIEADPSSAVAVAGRAYINQDFPEQALVDSNRAIELDPDYAEAYRIRAYMRKQLGEFHGALLDYDRALQLDPKDFLAYADRALIRIEQEEGDAALSDLNEALRLNPGESDVFLLRAHAWILKQDVDSALADFSEAVRRDPANSLALSSRGEFYLDHMDAPEKALDDLDAAIAAAPEDDFAFATRGRTHEAMGNYEEALADYDQAIHFAPQTAGGFYYRAKLYMSCPDANFRDVGRAVEDATRACELNQWKAPDFLSLLADAHAADGNLNAAIEWESKALELSADDEKAFHQRRLDELRKQQAVP